MNASYDAVVVGARCAGSATAMLLARKGYRVLTVDKASFPSDTLSTHYIHQPGTAALRRWGLLDEVAASGCPAIERQVFDVGPFALAGTPPPVDGVTAAYAPRRTVLDKILFDAAVAAGVEARERFAVKELLAGDDRAIGIRGRSEGGTLVSERARIVIGADGMRSRIAQMAGAPSYNEEPAHSCAYYSYWSGVAVQTAELYPRPDRMLIAAPTNDDLTLVIVYWPEAAFDAVRSDVEAQFWAALDLAPALAERVRAGERAEKFRGSVELGGFFRRPYGPGWALVGDAGYHKNPITAQGISDAFRDAELLAGAIDDALSGRVPEEEALAGYQAARDEAAAPMYALTTDLAKLQPPAPEMQALMAALAGNAAESDRFFGSIAGTVPLDEFFAPENIATILGAEVPA